MKYALIGCGTLLVLAVVVVGAAVWWLARNRDRIASNLETVAADGRRAGSGTDEQGCMRLATEYGGGGIRGMMNFRVFLEGCLRAAEETPGFCDGIPAEGEIGRTVSWSTAQCRGSSDPRCSSAMQAKLQYCWAGRPKGTQPVTGMGDSLPADTAAPRAGKSLDDGPVDDEPVDIQPIAPGALDTMTP